jgi:hypothetical protein
MGAVSVLGKKTSERERGRERKNNKKNKLTCATVTFKYESLL